MQTVYEDPTLLLLEKAHEVWMLSAVADYKERLKMVKDLHSYQTFSFNQLAKICRVSVPTISRHFKANSGGGRFAPETLTALITIRRMVLVSESIPKNILRLVVNNGTSIGTAARLTGTSRPTLYGRLHDYGN